MSEALVYMGQQFDCRPAQATCPTWRVMDEYMLWIS